MSLLAHIYEAVLLSQPRDYFEGALQEFNKAKWVRVVGTPADSSLALRRMSVPEGRTIIRLKYLTLKEAQKIFSGVTTPYIRIDVVVDGFDRREGVSYPIIPFESRDLERKLKLAVKQYIKKWTEYEL